MRATLSHLLLAFLGGWVALLGAAGAAEKAPSKSASTDAEPEWPQFLGPDRNGVSKETGLLASWPSDGPPEVWRIAGGEGKSGLAISGGRLFTMSQDADDQWLLCLNAKTGEQHWKTEIAPAYRNNMGDGPRATPTVAGDAVYVYTGEGILAAVQADSGKVTWKKDIVSQFGGKPSEYGMACSPLVVGERVIVIAGTPDATVAALDRKTGKVAWTAGKGMAAGYSSPALLKVDGRDQLVVFHGTGAMGLNPQTGAELWSYPYVTDFNCNIATPLAVDGGVFLSAGENHGSVLLSLKAQGDSFDVGQIWASQGPKSVLRNEWQTSILLDGSLYGFDNVGGAGPVSHLACVDAATGALRWRQNRFGKGNLIAADGKLFLSTIQGELVVLVANPERYEELGRKTVLDQTRQHPALAGGLLYLRDDREIVCLDVRKP